MGRELTQFKPGNKGGPGRKPISEEEKMARIEARHQIAVFPDLACLSVDELKIRLQAPDTPGYEALMISAILHGIKKGDMFSVLQFYERLLGKPKPPPDAEPPKRQSLADEGKMTWAAYYEQNADGTPLEEVEIEPEPEPQNPPAAEEPGVDPGDPPSPE